MKKRIAVSTSSSDKHDAAQQLAAELNLDFITTPEHAATYDYLLLLTSDKLVLQPLVTKKALPFYIDFLSAKMLYRSKHANLRNELIARTMKFKPSDHPRIIDATAGLGRDSFILATLGFEITMLERCPVLFALLRDALFRAQANVHIAPIVQRLHLVHANAITWLTQQETHPHVIYLDPMFPTRQKSASVKKELVILQDLLEKDSDSDQLLTVALSCAAHRVVIKRPRLAAYVNEQKPNFSFTGKHSRFDIYLSRQL